jgi:hypothetical protein
VPEASRPADDMGSADHAFEELEPPRPLLQRVADQVLKKILSEGLQPGDQWMVAAGAEG